MERPYTLDSDDNLKHSRFGHTPALWLALPILLGESLDGFYPLPVFTLLGLGFLTLIWLWIKICDSKQSSIAMAAAGLILGAVWHQVKLPPQSFLNVEEKLTELSVYIEQANTKREGNGWNGLGMITDKGDFFRRRIALSVTGGTPAQGCELKISGWISAVDYQAQGYDAWIKSQGATLKLSNGKIIGLLERPSNFSIWCQRTQIKLERWIRTLPWEDDDGGSLLAATLLGRTALLPPDAKIAFTQTGTLHLFAISGLHIAGMAAGMIWFIRKIKLPEKPAGVVILGLLWLYVEVTGVSPSSLRAWIMATFIWAGQISERFTSLIQSLALACAFTLILQPEAVNDPGFQLSYLAVLSIILIGAPAAKILNQPSAEEKMVPTQSQTWQQKTKWKIKKFLISGLCISTAATLAGLPLTITYFQNASLGGIVVNLILVPLSEIPLVCGMVSLFLYPWENLLPVAQWINGLGTLILNLMTLIAHFFAQVPGMNYQITSSNPMSGPICALIIMACFIYQAESKSVIKLIGIPALIVLGWVLFFVL
jgi:competence protein ComEC